MNYKELTAPCGLDCFNCRIYEGNITEVTITSLASSTGKAPEDIPCKGCRISGCTFFVEPCETLKCINAKGCDFCYECGDFPCDKLLPCQDGADKPHNMKIFNLCRIQRYGLDRWAPEAINLRKKYYEGTLVLGKGPIIQT